MYITLTWLYENPDTGEIEYDSGDFQIKGLTFAPQVDLTGNSLPVNEYTCQVILPEPLPGELASASLYDDMDQLWCSFPLTKVINVTAKCLALTASSWIKRLEDRQLDETVYVNETAENAIEECFGAAYANDYTIATAIASKTVSGYAPAQTGRERLTWLCFVLGAYVDDIYRGDALITEVDDTATLIPIDKTYGGSQRPTLDNGQWVTGLKITTYAFRQGTQEEWEADDSSYMFPLPWIATTQEFTISNPAAPLDARPNVVELDNLYLINSGNVSGIAARLAQYWFNPVTAQISVINNRSYKPGDLVTGYTAPDSLITGYVQQGAFAFGKQAMSKLSLIGVESIDGARLVINYKYNNRILSSIRYYLPVGAAFAISNPYLDRMEDGHRIIYRPTTENAEGTMVDGGLTVNVNYGIALDLFEGILHIISVDEVTEQSSGGETIGVIA